MFIIQHINFINTLIDDLIDSPIIYKLLLQLFSHLCPIPTSVKITLHLLCFIRNCHFVRTNVGFSFLLLTVRSNFRFKISSQVMHCYVLTSLFTSMVTCKCTLTSPFFPVALSSLKCTFSVIVSLFFPGGRMISVIA